MEEINRVLRDLTGSASRIEGKIDAIARRLDDHMGEDIRKFDLARAEITQLRDSMHSEFETQDRSRNARLDTLEALVNRAKGAWWVLGIAGAGVAGLVTTIIELFPHHK